MARTDRPTHYQVLGVMADATTDQIRAAYRDQAKLAHPDAGGDPEHFRLVLEAYQTLSNPGRRRDYDDAEGIRTPTPSSEGGGPGGGSAGGGSTQGWTGTRGDFSGSVQFPSYLRDITEKPWDTARRDDEERTERERLDPVARALPADVVWWWPDQAVAAPVSAGPLLVVPGASSLAALSALTGHEAWRTELGARPAGRAIVVDDLALVWCDDDSVSGIELADGRLRWRRPIGPPSRGGLVHIERVVVAARADGRVIGIEPASGATAWGSKLTTPPSTPLAAVPTDGVAVALTPRSVEAIEARKGKHRWRISLRAPVELPPCVVGNTVWLAGGGAPGSLVRLDAATGAVQGTFRAGSAIAGLTADPDTGTVFASVAGPPRLIAIDEGARLHLSVDLPTVCPEPALTESRAFLIDPTGRLLTIDRLQRTIVAAATLPFEPIGAPMVVGERLVMLARDGRLWATEQPYP